ncbi:hypothetical protein BCR37DRAFT_396556 [Protomyces lactucae-debilis]|uniref:Copper acquisition factor BIM1-like domain-containing protein n=1 Tax=Protomyces lactucae-debilis TaxID=2754530 RepID=A0A1Y2FSF2_PROLT|nr:uncharacterized protein BCR37DRAFT_396556 [Protomyces lactucae-debilis]ORY86940.1 hypothetical protein BCR37DRAFT_396556 [Protomyces lactucae-debilis]
MVTPTTLLSFLTVAGLAAGHFTLDQPQTRGFDDDREAAGPCGGFSAIENRTPFSIRGGSYQIGSHHASATVQLRFSTDGQDFTGEAVTSYTTTGLGTVCGRLPGELFANAGFAVGQNVSMQIQFQSTNEAHPLFQCADLTLVDDATETGSCKTGTNVKISNLQVNGTSSPADISFSSAPTPSATPSASVRTSDATAAFSITAFVFSASLLSLAI